MTQRKPIYHVVSHSHWDREWYLTHDGFRVWLCEMIDELIATLSRDEKYHCFLLDGQMAMLLDYLELRPSATDAVRAFARQGRLSLGPWYTLADLFLPSGESHVRNLLIGMSEAREFGEPLMVGYVPDQFGHIAQLPQILRGFQIDCAVIYRGFGGEPGQEPSEYRWCAPDGSSVLLHHLPKDGYSFGYFALDTDEQILDRFRRIDREASTRTRAAHRLILNGGDHFFLDPSVAHAIELLNRQTDATCIHSSLDRFMRELASSISDETLPVVQGELRFGLKHAFAVIAGTASSRMSIKQRNAESEALLEQRLDPLNAMAVQQDATSHADMIRYAWKLLLQNQDHDVICGASIDAVYREAMLRYEKITAIADRLIPEMMRAFIPRDAACGDDDRSILIFNFLPIERDDIVEASIDFHLKDIIIGINPDATELPPRAPVASFRILDSENNEVPHQILETVETESIDYFRHRYPRQRWVQRVRLLLDLHSLPPFGYTSFTIERDALPARIQSDLFVTERSIDNQYVRIVASIDGRITIEDKHSGVQYEDIFRIEDSSDEGDEYTYCPPDGDIAIDSRTFLTNVECIETGPLRASIRIATSMTIPRRRVVVSSGEEQESGLLKVATTISLTTRSRRIDFQTDVVNTTDDHRIRAIFDTRIKTRTSHAGSQFTIVSRDHHELHADDYPYETPQNLSVLHRFVTIRDEARGMTLFTRGLPEYELASDSSGMLALTLLRCVGELSRTGLRTRPGGDAGWKNKTPDAQSHGEHGFGYALLLHGPNGLRDILNESERYFSALLPVSRKETFLTPLSKSFFKMDAVNSRLSIVKESEKRDGWIIRWFNPTDEHETVRVTFFFPVESIDAARLDESVIGPIDRCGDAVAVATPPHSIVTIRVKAMQ